MLALTLSAASGLKERITAAAPIAWIKAAASAGLSCQGDVAAEVWVLGVVVNAASRFRREFTAHAGLLEAVEARCCRLAQEGRARCSDSCYVFILLESLVPTPPLLSE